MHRNIFIRYLFGAIPIVALFLIWELLSLFVGSYKFPHIVEVISEIIRSFLQNPIIEAQGGGDSGYLPHIIATTQTFLLGFLLGSIIGFFLAIFVFQSPMMLGLFDPILEMFRVVPPLIMIPFILLIFPATEIAQVLISGIYAIYSICVYTLNSLQNIDKKYHSMAIIYGATRWQRIKTVQIPAVMSELIGGLRVTSALTLGIIVVAEYLGSPYGIGRVLKYAISYTAIDLIMAGIFWAVVIAIIMDTIIVFAFHLSLLWSERTTRSFRAIG